MSRRQKRNAIKPAMNVTPLVDVVLVLLIIFMVVLPAMNEGLNLELPFLTHVDPDESSSVDPFLLSVTRDGSIYFEAERLDASGFRSTLTAANRREPNRKLVLRADSKARYAHVRSLMAELQDLGFPGISFRVHTHEQDAQTDGGDSHGI